MKNYLLASTGRFGRMAMRLKDDSTAVTALEYALISGVIVATILVGFQTLASGMATKFSAIGTTLTAP